MISVIIPTYNMKDTIGRAIDSVLGQDAKLFIVDDGSTDGTTEWVMREYPTIGLLRLEKNMGMSVAMNEALKFIDTEYILPLAADDMLDKNCIDNWSKQSLVDVNYCRLGMTPVEPEKILLNIRKNIRNKLAGVHHCHQFYTNDGRHITDGAGCLCLRTDMIKRELYDENLRYKEGGELIVRLALKGYEFKFFDFVGGRIFGHKKSLEIGNKQAIKYIKNKYRDFNLS